MNGVTLQFYEYSAFRNPEIIASTMTDCCEKIQTADEVLEEAGSGSFVFRILLTVELVGMVQKKSSIVPVEEPAIEDPGRGTDEC